MVKSHISGRLLRNMSLGLDARRRGDRLKLRSAMRGVRQVTAS
jgi:hypothetical protein